jgi:hypothetical protein
MVNLRQIHEILDSSLTTEILQSLDSKFQRWFDLFRTEEAVFLRHRKIQITLLEKVGEKLEENLGKTLKGENLLEVSRRVDTFLIGQGYQIKPFL